jgi:hypothetical protein
MKMVTAQAPPENGLTGREGRKGFAKYAKVEPKSLPFDFISRASRSFRALRVRTVRINFLPLSSY